MSQRRHESIEFPANPFVAYADFLILVLLVLILIFIQQSILTTGTLERLILERHQQSLTIQTTQRAGSLGTAAPITLFYVDGDLQRFRIDGAHCFDHGSSKLKPEAAATLRRFGKLLREFHGKDAPPGYGMYKRVEVHGSTDLNECPKPDTWRLSLQRAEQAGRALLQGGLSPKVLVISGRGEQDLVYEYPHQSNRRIDIVIVYSAKNVAKMETTASLSSQDGSR